jgi:hypothetical protein
MRTHSQPPASGPSGSRAPPAGAAIVVQIPVSASGSGADPLAALLGPLQGALGGAAPDAGGAPIMLSLPGIAGLGGAHARASGSGSRGAAAAGLGSAVPPPALSEKGKERKTGSKEEEELARLYEGFEFEQLWRKLSDALDRLRGDSGAAMILLPLIEVSVA